MTVIEKSFYVVGGTLHRDALSYVCRRADDELLDGLSAGHFCYVLTSRQMGKSSLMVRTATRLRDERGATIVVLDLTAIGQNLTAEQWYEGLLNLVGQQLHLEDLLEDFWLSHERLGPLQRWMRAIREVVLRHCSGQVVIFVDEIDAVRSLPFSTDEFFAAIRELYNARTEEDGLRRLTFCLLGVATPSDLIADTRTTPFNIGRRIELNDFTEAEAAPLAEGFGKDAKLGRRLMQRVIHWTGGHPYLTQRLCQAAADDGGIHNANDVDRLCEERFFSSRSREQDDNLLFVRQRLLRSEVDAVNLLELYEKIHRGQPVRDDDTSALIDVLRLSGIARVDDGRLVVRNRIYARVFDREWVAANMPDAELQRQRRAYRRGQFRTAALAAVIIALLSVAWLVTQRALETNRRLLYVARMNLAQQSWESGNAGRTLELLDETKLDTDLHGFEWRYLQRLCHSELYRFQHGGAVLAAAFSSDGKMLAVAGRDGVVKLWNLATRQELPALHQEKQVNAVVFLPGTGTLVTGGDDQAIRLWDTTTSTEIALLGAHNSPIHSLALYAPRNLLLSASEDGVVKIWDFRSRQLLNSLPETTPTQAMILSPDGKTMVIGSRVGTLEIWDFEQESKRGAIRLRNSESRIRALAFSPQGNLLAVGNESGEVVLCEVAARKELPMFKPESRSVLALAFSPDGRALAIGGEDKTVRLWDVFTRQELRIWKGHLDLIHAIAFSPDGLTLASGSEDGTTRLWQADQQQDYATFDWPSVEIRSLAFSADSKQLAVGAGNSIKLLDLVRNEVRDIPAHAGPISSLAFAPDVRRLATASDDETLKLWELGAQPPDKTLLEGAGELRLVAFSPDGRQIAVGCGDRIVRLLDAGSGRQLAELPEEVEAIYAMAFLPDAATLAIGNGGGRVKLWNLAQRRAIAPIKVHEQPTPINSIAVTADGQTLATASDSTARLWQVGSEKPKLLLKGHAGDILTLAFSPDGRRLATGSRDNTIKLWDVERGLQIANFTAHRDEVRSLAFSPDGKMLASSSKGTMKLWRANQ